ncbi:MAG: hypothetical protein N3A65_05970 [candidate division WOR-3 bacterium]|nr:hypothetical protein [candidate division WOR-3 bacterium]
MKIVFLYILVSNLNIFELAGFSVIVSQNQIPICEVNRGEAEFCRFSTEIDSFAFDRVFENNESIQIVNLYTVYGDTVDSVANSNKEVFKRKKFYRKNFHWVITNLNFWKDSIMPGETEYIP